LAVDAGTTASFPRLLHSKTPVSSSTARVLTKRRLAIMTEIVIARLVSEVAAYLRTTDPKPDPPDHTHRLNLWN
jgi:hypothetical protein